MALRINANQTASTLWLHRCPNFKSSSLVLVGEALSTRRMHMHNKWGPSPGTVKLREGSSTPLMVDVWIADRAKSISSVQPVLAANARPHDGRWHGEAPRWSLDQKPNCYCQNQSPMPGILIDQSTPSCAVCAAVKYVVCSTDDEFVFLQSSSQCICVQTRV